MVGCRWAISGGESETALVEVMNSDQDLGPHQERYPIVSDRMTTDGPFEEHGLRILAESGAQID